MSFCCNQIKNSQLTCMANRDLTRRVKQLSQDVFPYSKEAVRADIELAIKLVQYLDNKHELFTEVHGYWLIN